MPYGRPIAIVKVPVRDASLRRPQDAVDALIRAVKATEKRQRIALAGGNAHVETSIVSHSALEIGLYPGDD